MLPFSGISLGHPHEPGDRYSNANWRALVWLSTIQNYMKTLTISKQAPGLFDYVNRMAELPVCVSHRQAGTFLSLGSIGSSHRLGEISSDHAVADKNTIWDFKQRLIEAGVMEKLFERFKEYLKDQGLIAQEGKIVDATFIDIPRQRNSRSENEAIKEGKTAEEWEDQAAKLRQKDTDARWAKKGEEVHFGYKNHVKVDEKSKLIEKYEVTDASVHDSQKIEDLVEKGDGSTVSSPSNGRVHGDSAYRSAQIEKDRKEKAVESRIHEQGYRNRPLTEEQKENNRQKSRVRARIEHVFGYMTNSMGGIFLTCIGMRRTTAAIGLMNLIYNMARYEQLMRLANSS